MKRTRVAIVGAGPYGLSLSAHLATRNVDHCLLGRPMQFWSNVAGAGGDRFLRTYCFGTNISTPRAGFSFVDYSRPRGLETFEPCSISDFVSYGHWFQQANVSNVVPIDVVHVSKRADGFELSLADGQVVFAERVVIATGLACYANVPSAIGSLPSTSATHTSAITSFKKFEGLDVAVIGAGQSALEAAALLHEAGARPQLIVRKSAIQWMSRVPSSRNLWKRLRSPISALGSGPKAFMLAKYPGAMHRLPDDWRAWAAKSYLTPAGAWWLRGRIEQKMPLHAHTVVEKAFEDGGRVTLQLDGQDGGPVRSLIVDHVILGTGYDIDVDRLAFLDATLRASIGRLGRAPRLNATFETTVPGLAMIGPVSTASFGPLFRFVAGAEYTASVIASSLAQPKAASARQPHGSGQMKSNIQ